MSGGAWLTIRYGAGVRDGDQGGVGHSRSGRGFSRFCRHVSEAGPSSLHLPAGSTADGVSARSACPPFRRGVSWPTLGLYRSGNWVSLQAQCDSRLQACSHGELSRLLGRRRGLKGWGGWMVTRISGGRVHTLPRNEIKRNQTFHGQRARQHVFVSLPSRECSVVRALGECLDHLSSHEQPTLVFRCFSPANSYGYT